MDALDDLRALGEPLPPPVGGYASWRFRIPVPRGFGALGQDTTPVFDPASGGWSVPSQDTPPVDQTSPGPVDTTGQVWGGVDPTAMGPPSGSDTSSGSGSSGWSLPSGVITGIENVAGGLLKSIFGGSTTPSAGSAPRPGYVWSPTAGAYVPAGGGMGLLPMVLIGGVAFFGYKAFTRRKRSG